MNLHGLRIFHAIATLGGVSRASEYLRISQPAVTMQLRKLENELGFQLTRMNGRGIVLTEAGDWLAAQAARLFALEAEIDQQCKQYQQGSKGSLTLISTYLPANYILPAKLAEYRKQHPDVQVSLTSSNTQTAIDKLLRYEADLAFIGGHPYRFPEEIESFVIQEDELWFVALPSHPLAHRKVQFHEVNDYPCIVRETGSFTRDAWLSLCTSSGVPEPQSTIEVSGPQEALRAALSGLGITLASRLEAIEYVENGLLIRLNITESQTINAINCCMRANDPLPPQVRSFAQLFKQI
ncbi:LysR family transcriptional regulator [Paenibacillus albiflavus]|uniref:LysR family transcriptional regulator n=1 Tax=Paenibacillus albiflavus TaxID=2545760 RepID=A0A4R4EK69_9BACL|nr:LysR family transcriptional regulator [Paenibacillus albiflavus]TCZ80147.1 LysR family transcriptional regulator [Paenibacillus albiflavus]